MTALVVACSSALHFTWPDAAAFGALCAAGAAIAIGFLYR